MPACLGPGSWGSPAATEGSPLAQAGIGLGPSWEDQEGMEKHFHFLNMKKSMHVDILPKAKCYCTECNTK